MSTVDITEKKQYDEAEAKRGLTLIAQNADMLEQTAQNMEQLLEQIDDQNKEKILGYEIKLKKGYSYGKHELTHGDDTIPVPYANPHDYDSIRQFVRNTIDDTSHNLTQVMKNVGRLVHEVLQDCHRLQPYELRMLEDLPRVLKDAENFMAQSATVLSNQHDHQEHTELLTQVRRDTKFLGKLAEEIGGAGLHLAHYNELTIERQSDLATEQDISNDKSQKFEQGMKLLGKSYSDAHGKNPSFRAKVSKRVPLPVLENEGLQR